MIEIGGTPPAGWLYVASHPLAKNYTKIGYSKWHPIEPCFKYPNGFKRLHHLEFSIRAFGLGELNKWASDYHSEAQHLEKQIRHKLADFRRRDVGTSREIFNISHADAIQIVKDLVHAQTH